MDLALNNLQGLICHKTQQTKPNTIPVSATELGYVNTDRSIKERH